MIAARISLPAFCAAKKAGAASAAAEDFSAERRVRCVIAHAGPIVNRADGPKSYSEALIFLTVAASGRAL